MNIICKLIIRVVRHEMHYTLYKVTQDKRWYTVEKDVEANYFTNLPDDIAAQEVAMLYSAFRWKEGGITVLSSEGSYEYRTVQHP